MRLVDFTIEHNGIDLKITKSEDYIIVLKSKNERKIYITRTIDYASTVILEELGEPYSNNLLKLHLGQLLFFLIHGN